MDYDEKLRDLAANTPLRLTNRFVRGTSLPFRFLDLPKEVQYEILSYTRLVAKHRWHLISLSNAGASETGLSSTCDEHGIAATYDEYGEALMRASLTRCFCARVHSAFTFRCSCENELVEYLLVSREFRQVAERVYYGGNGFMIENDGFVPAFHDIASREWLGRDIVETIPFVKWIPTDCFRYIKHFRWNFDRLEPNSGLLSPAGWKQWLSTIDFPSTTRKSSYTPFRYSNGGALLVCFVERGVGGTPPNLDGVEEKRDARMRTFYLKIFRSMTILRGVKDLFIHLNYGTSDGYSDGDGRVEQERILESLIMGDEYDAWNRGKMTRFPFEYMAWGYPPPMDDE